jgi:hypothetical protein
MHFYLDHAVSGERQFVENFTDNAEHGARFRGYVPENFKAGREVRRHQSRKEGVLIIQYYLAERCRRFGYGARLYSFQDGIALKLANHVGADNQKHPKNYEQNESDGHVFRGGFVVLVRIHVLFPLQGDIK